MLTVEPVAATAAGAVCAALGAPVGAAAPAAAGAVGAEAGADAGCEQAAASASAAMPPTPFNRSRRLTDAILVSPSLSLSPHPRRCLRRCDVGRSETGPAPAAPRTACPP